MQPLPTTRLRRRIYVGVTALATAGLAVSPAGAASPTDVSVAASPAVLTVGQTNGSFTLTITNTGTEVEPQTIADLVLTPSCAAIADSGCATADPGVFRLRAAKGSAGACENLKFTLGAPDVRGAVRITADRAIELVGAQAACTITIAATVLAMPMDSSPIPGAQTLPVLSYTRDAVTLADTDNQVSVVEPATPKHPGTLDTG